LLEVGDYIFLEYMAIMHGKQSEYLKKQEIRYKFLGLLIPLILLVGDSFWVGYMLGGKIRYTIPQTLVIIVIFVGAFYFYGKFSKYAERKMDAYYYGLKGEGCIYFELKKLPKDYLVFQDVKMDQGGNIDFIVVGSTGFFTVEVKNYSGQITFENGVLLHDNTPFEKDVINQVMGQWTSLRTYLEQKINRQIPYIQPILVFAGNRVQMNFGMNPVTKNIVIIKQEWLNQVITESRQKLSPQEIDMIGSELVKLVEK
jgi:hypothetical protein